MRIFTENSLYVWDVAEQTVTRSNLSGEPLRRDDEPIRCVFVGVVADGLPALLVLDLIGDGTLTFRETSPVVSVEP